MLFLKVSFNNFFWSIIKHMSGEIRFKEHSIPSNNKHETRRVDVTSLVNKLNEEKKKEKKSNIALSVAAVSAVTVFGIILSL